MIGDDYLLKLGRASQNEVSLALYSYFHALLSKTETEDLAGRLAAALPMTILGEPAQELEHQAFREEHESQITAEARKLAPHDHLCEILSGAAYNIGYGRYLEKGGSRLFNAFLSYIRLEGRALSDSDNKRMLNYHLDLLKRDSTILRPMEALKDLGLWHSRGPNPNELDYYNAVHQFAQENGVSFK